MPLTDQQKAFIRAYLGTKLPQYGDAHPVADVQLPLKHWQTGKEIADKAISLLQKELKSFEHPDLNQIAEYGLHGFGGQHQTKLMAALTDYARSNEDGRETAANAVSKHVAEYRGFLSSNPVLTLCEANPFGIKVDIRGPLGAALDEIEKNLAA